MMIIKIKVWFRNIGSRKEKIKILPNQEYKKPSTQFLLGDFEFYTTKMVFFDRFFLQMGVFSEINYS